MAKHSKNILELAKKGATHRLQELKEEIASLVKHFPHLRAGSAVSPAVDVSSEPAALIGRKRKQSKMSVAARKAVSLRMKKYWAARRKETASRSK